MNTNSSYFILSRASDTVFEAFPVNAWYNFTPTISYKTLDADEAEEQFGKRNKTYNYFAVMLQKKMQNEVSEDKVETTIKPDQLVGLQIYCSSICMVVIVLSHKLLS